MPHRDIGYYNLYSNSNYDYNYYSNVRRPAAAMGHLAGIAMTNPSHLGAAALGNVEGVIEDAKEEPLLYGGIAAIAASLFINMKKDSQDMLMKGGVAAVAAHFIIPMIQKDQVDPLAE